MRALKRVEKAQENVKKTKRRKNVTLKTKSPTRVIVISIFYTFFSYIAHSQSELELPRKKTELLLLNVRCLRKGAENNRKFTCSLVFLESHLLLGYKSLLNVSSHVHLYILYVDIL